jgi:lipooligosaccharide transport system permease protein
MSQTGTISEKSALPFGAWFVAEHRIRTMGKWLTSIVANGLGNPVLYLVSIGLGVGTLVDKNLGANAIDGVGYLTFLAPALLATAAIQGAMDETSFPTLEGFSWEKTFFGMNSTALTGRQISAGVLIASFIRCLLTVVLYTVILFAFGAVTLSAIPGLILASLFAGMAMGSAMLATASFIKEDDGIFAVVGRFIIAPMFMFSGTFYPIETLPIYLQWVGWISPLWHATDMGRAISYGHTVAPLMMAAHFLYLGVMFAVTYALAARQFAKRLSL